MFFEGGEDDDLYYRMNASNIPVVRPANNTKYKMLKHYGQWRNPDRFKTLESGLKNFKIEGLNSVKYEYIGHVIYPLFTHLLIDIGD